MILKTSLVLVLALVLVLVCISRVKSSCTDVPNEDKIDCAQHESWTEQSCLAKGCCHKEVSGFPACYYPFGNKHEARCLMSVSERHDCGNADTTEISCIKSGCCWQMTPGAPFCYRAKEVVTDSPTTVQTGPTTVQTGPTTVRIDGSTDPSIVENPPQCKNITNEDKIDCAANDPKWTPKSCLAKGCCHIEVAGYPACFYSHGLHHDAKCQVSTVERKDCGDAKTTAIECETKGCCWQMTPGSPFCYQKMGSDTTDNPVTPVTGSTSPGSNVTTGPVNPGKGCDIAIPVREEVHKGTKQECESAGYCWRPGGGSPSCYKPHKDGGIHVYIHMMPWFETKATNNGKWGQHWTMANINPDQMDSSGKRKIASKFYPLIDLYASGDPHVVDWQLGLMKLSGVTGVLIDWPGIANVWDYPTNHKNCLEIIKGCERVGLQYAIVYEDHNLGMARDAHLLKTDIITQGKADMAYLRDNHFGKSNYIKINGAPLLLDFGPQTLVGGSQWEQLFSVFTEKPTFLTLWNQMDQAGKMAKGEFAWIYSNYLEGLTNFYHYKDIDLKFGCAYPGFDSAYTLGGWPGPTWVIPHSVSTFEKTLDLAISFGVNHIQVATWNDYGEGTIIEPTKEHGYSMLTTLQRKLGVKHTQADLEKVTAIFNQRKLYSSNQTVLDILDKQFQSLINF